MGAIIRRRRRGRGGGTPCSGTSPRRVARSPRRSVAGPGRTARERGDGHHREGAAHRRAGNRSWGLLLRGSELHRLDGRALSLVVLADALGSLVDSPGQIAIGHGDRHSAFMLCGNFQAFRSLLLLQLTMSLRESGPEPGVHFQIRRSGRRRSRRRGRRGLLLVGLLQTIFFTKVECR